MHNMRMSHANITLCEENANSSADCFQPRYQKNTTSKSSLNNRASNIYFLVGLNIVTLVSHIKSSTRAMRFKDKIKNYSE